MLVNVGDKRKMNKQKALRILNEFKNQIHDPEGEFITVYYNLKENKDLSWCCGITEAIDQVKTLTNNHKIALEFTTFDMFKE